jgi:hypothetical protein
LIWWGMQPLTYECDSRLASAKVCVDWRTAYCDLRFTPASVLLVLAHPTKSNALSRA